MRFYISRILETKKSKKISYPSVIFIHGFMKDYNDWNIDEKKNNINIQKKISTDTCTVNFHFESRDYFKSFLEICDKIYVILMNNDIPKPWIFVGHSIGGLYSQAYAKLYPEHVRGLVLINPNEITRYFQEHLVEAVVTETDSVKKNIYQNWIMNFYQVYNSEILNKNITVICHKNISTNKDEIDDHINKYFDGDRDEYEEMTKNMLLYYNMLIKNNRDSFIIKYKKSSPILHHKHPKNIISSIYKLLYSIK